MKAKKVLFISQDITPYVPASDISELGRRLPQFTQENGCEIRTFMPKWGNINERRNQLHEVIRLSGMNLIVNDTDHPLIIKVASIQSARMQVYFIDNDDYFQSRPMVAPEGEEPYADNEERAVFYARGVLETVKKLRWAPDVIHCHGWISALAPFYVKTFYKDEPSFRDAKVVYSSFGNDFTTPVKEQMANRVMIKGMPKSVVNQYNKVQTCLDLERMALQYSDGFVVNSATVNADLVNFAASCNLPTLNYESDLKTFYGQCTAFYDTVLGADKEQAAEQ